MTDKTELSGSPSVTSESAAVSVRPTQGFPAHLFVEASAASFWKGVDDLAALGFHGTEADNTLAHLSETYGGRVQEFRDRMAKYQMKLPALYHVLPINEPSRRDENIEEGLRVGKFIHDVGGSILNLAGGKRPREGNLPEDYRVLAEVGNELGRRLQEE